MFYQVQAELLQGTIIALADERIVREIISLIT